MAAAPEIRRGQKGVRRNVHITVVDKVDARLKSRSAPDSHCAIEGHGTARDARPEGDVFKRFHSHTWSNTGR